MSAVGWRVYKKGVPYTASEAEKLLKEAEERVFNLFDLEAAWRLAPAMPIHQATADMKPFFPADGYGRSTAIVMLDEAVAENRRRLEELAFLKALNPADAYNAADRKAKTAKNKRRSRARWRRREARRLGQELLCMRTDGDPEREASEFAARALPALAPKVTARGEEGKPGPGAGVEPNEIYDDLPFIERDDRVRYVFKIRTPLPSAKPQPRANRFRASDWVRSDPDGPPSKVPLRSKPAEPEPRPYVPMKWGEHD